MEHNTLVVNLYAGPGAGKSTCAAYLFAKLKMRGISAEYVTEYAKDVTWDGTKEKLDLQVYITGKQAYRMKRVYGKVDVIVTDSPLALGCMYTDDEAMKQVCLHEGEKYKDNWLNIFLKRSPNIAYQPEGRNQTQDEAARIDADIKTMLRDVAKYPFDEIDPTDENALNGLVDRIAAMVGRISGVAAPAELSIAPEFLATYVDVLDSEGW